MMVKNKKTKKNWLVTEFISSYSSLNQSNPDVFSVRLSNGMGKTILVSVDDINTKYQR